MAENERRVPLEGGSMPIGYAEARNIVFLKSAMRGRSLFTEKKGTMKAIRIHNYGGPEVLHYEEAPRPKPEADGVFLPAYPAPGEPAPAGRREWRTQEEFT